MFLKGYIGSICIVRYYFSIFRILRGYLYNFVLVLRMCQFLLNTATLDLNRA